jgi:hypothetical protein
MRTSTTVSSGRTTSGGSAALGSTGGTTSFAGTAGAARRAGAAGAATGRALPGRTVESAVLIAVAIGDFGFPMISGTPTLTERDTSRE